MVVEKYNELYKWLEQNTEVDLSKYKKLDSFDFMNSKDNSINGQGRKNI